MHNDPRRIHLYAGFQFILAVRRTVGSYARSRQLRPVLTRSFPQYPPIVTTTKPHAVQQALFCVLRAGPGALTLPTVLVGGLDCKLDVRMHFSFELPG